MYIDNAFKYVAILNRNVPPGRMMNVLAHGANALQRKLRDHPDPRFAAYIDGSAEGHGEFSIWPYIVLEASSSEKLRNARRKMQESGLIHVDMTASMIGSSNEEQLLNTRNQQEKDVEYLGLFAFGSTELMDPVCKKFSLFKGFRAGGEERKEEADYNLAAASRL